SSTHTEVDSPNSSVIFCTTGCETVASESDERYDIPKCKTRCRNRYLRPFDSMYPSNSNVINNRRTAARESSVTRAMSAIDKPCGRPSNASITRKPRASDSTKSGLPSCTARSEPQRVRNRETATSSFVAAPGTFFGGIGTSTETCGDAADVDMNSSNSMFRG